MSVLRSLLTAGVLASGLLWSLNGITATPAAQASDDRYEVTQQRNPDAAVINQIPKVCMENMLPLSTRITNCRSPAPTVTASHHRNTAKG